MSKKDDLKNELGEVTDEALLEDISDDILLNEDLDDPLLAEAEALLGIAKPTPKKISQKPKKVPEKAKLPQNHEKSGSKAIINKQTMKEFTVFILKKAKVYEEISFETILRKLPPSWNFTEPILIDVLEALIESKTITAIKMKMTALSLKFYAATNVKDKKL